MSIDFHIEYVPFINYGWVPKFARVEWSNQHVKHGVDRKFTFWRFAIGFDTTVET